MKIKESLIQKKIKLQADGTQNATHEITLQKLAICINAGT